MRDRHYLGNVLGLSIGPRVITSVLTVVSLPILMRAVGASDYGIIVYLGAVVGVLESLADFGVSSAAGKGVADARARRPRALPAEVANWARLQSVVALLGAIPVFGISYLYVRYAGTIKVDVLLLTLVVASTWVSIVTNFVRACIRSCLHFKSLMVLDTTESVTRSSTWIAVAYYMPSAMGVALAGAITAVLTSAAGVVALVYVVRQYVRAQEASERKEETHSPPSYREMIRGSLHFLGLRFSTRMTQALPVIIIGRTVGAGPVGVIGAFSRISELLGFPFAVIGNALSVRAQEVVLKEMRAIVALWNTVLRFVAVAAVVAGCVALVATPLAGFLLPGDPSAVPQFAVLSLTIVTSVISSLIAPMSDYIGALPRRVALLSGMAIAQVPVLYIGGTFFGPVGAVAAYVLALCSTSAGYVFIAKRAFFGTAPYRPSSDVSRFSGIVLGSLVLSVCSGIVGFWSSLSAAQMAAVRASLFLLMVIAGVLANRVVRNALISQSLFDFTAQS